MGQGHRVITCKSAGAGPYRRRTQCDGVGGERQNGSRVSERPAPIRSAGDGAIACLFFSNTVRSQYESAYAADQVAHRRD